MSGATRVQKKFAIVRTTAEAESLAKKALHVMFLYANEILVLQRSLVIKNVDITK